MNESSPTAKHVLAFAELMEAQLEKNRYRGDRDGWLKQNEGEHLKAVESNLDQIERCLEAGGSNESMRKHVADAANRLMMLLDVYENVR
jgi:hypothetical protein